MWKNIFEVMVKEIAQMPTDLQSNPTW